MNNLKDINIFDISKYFILKGVSPLKLQKLLYYSQVWYYVKYKKQLYRDNIFAWIFGPVVYSVWNEYRFVKRNENIPHIKGNNHFLAKDIEEHLEEIWNIYGKLSGAQLVELTHNEVPWKNSRQGLLNSQPSMTEVFINDLTTYEFKLVGNKIPDAIANIESLGSFSNNNN